MNSRIYTVKLKERDIKITSQHLNDLADMYIADAELRSRMSELIWLDMAVMDFEFGVSPHDILSSIQELEAGPGPTGTKAPTPFNNLPLKGFWHKHFFSAQFLVKNIQLGLGKNGLEKIINEVMGTPDGSPVTKEMIEELAHRIPNDPIECRDAAKKLTGEWVVYLPRGGKNYYMCCNTHEAGDQFVYDRIMENCIRDFPHLPQWVNDAR